MPLRPIGPNPRPVYRPTVGPLWGSTVGEHIRAARWPWPQLPTGTKSVRRPAMLDDALLDRQISAAEGDDSSNWATNSACA
jgi:hypothetical protein